MSDMEAPEPVDLDDEALADDPDFDGDMPEDPEGYNAADTPAADHQDVAEQEGSDDDEWPDPTEDDVP